MKCSKCGGFCYLDGDSYKCIMGHREYEPLRDIVQFEGDYVTISFHKRQAVKEHISLGHYYNRAAEQYRKRERTRRKRPDPQGRLF